MNADNKLRFRETQRFKQWWVWALLIASNGLVLVLLLTRFQSLLTGAETVKAYAVLALGAFMLIAPTVLFLFIRLDTIIDHDRIAVRLYPFHIRYRYYPKEEVASCTLRTYRPLGEYGGWGLRGTARNRAFNISGNQGIQLVLANGNKVLIGTNAPEEVNAVLIALKWIET
jgi:hypothetical protein